MTASARTAVGVDVGGTNIRAARVGATGAMEDHLIEPVEVGREAFMAQLLRLVETVADDSTAGVGIGVPGRVDAANGVILSAGYLDIAGLDIPGRIRQRLVLEARVENDATMALIAEAHARPEVAQGLILMVTVGTGIGGAILLDGAPWYGGGISGQFGHMVVAGDGPRCNCGRRGCIETFSSGTALGRLVAEAGLQEGLKARDVFQRAKQGDKTASDVLINWAGPFRRALDSALAAFDPRLIVVGGGLGQEMVGALSEIDNEGSWFGCPVEAAKLGDKAGVIGAGLRCFARDER